LTQDVIQLQSEIERLQTVGKLGNFNENKQMQHLEADRKTFENEIGKYHEELKKAQDQIVLLQKEKLEEDKKNLEKKMNLKIKRKKCLQKLHH